MAIGGAANDDVEGQDSKAIPPRILLVVVPIRNCRRRLLSSLFVFAVPWETMDSTSGDDGDCDGEKHWTLAMTKRETRATTQQQRPPILIMVCKCWGMCRLRNQLRMTADRPASRSGRKGAARWPTW